MGIMKTLFYKLPETVVKCFWKYNLFWHFLAATLTYFIVVSGLDWWYFRFSRGIVPQRLFFYAIILGGLLPIIAPLILFVIGKIYKNLKTVNTAWALTQAGLFSLGVSSFYKVFTGRVPPELSYDITGALTDISRQFQFGFMRGGLFWGWPSSHTTIAFAAAAVLFILYPQNRSVRWVALIYAIYIGIGVSVNIHWFSEFVAGAIIGTIIGIVVGKSFRERSVLMR